MSIDASKGRVSNQIAQMITKHLTELHLIGSRLDPIPNSRTLLQMEELMEEARKCLSNALYCLRTLV